MFRFLLLQVAIHLPTLLVLFAGAVLFLVSRRRLGSLATALGTIGCVMLVINALLAVLWTLFIVNSPSLVGDDKLQVSSVETYSALYSVVNGSLTLLGLALLIACALVRRPAAHA